MDIYQKWGDDSHRNGDFPGDVDCLEDSDIQEMVNVLGLVSIPYIGTILGMIIVAVVVSSFKPNFATSCS